MSNDAKLKCPVCHASQQLSDCCRRCRADIRLLKRLHLRINYLKSNLDHEIDGSEQQARWQAELKRLAPKS